MQLLGVYCSVGNIGIGPLLIKLNFVETILFAGEALPSELVPGVVLPSSVYSASSRALIK